MKHQYHPKNIGSVFIVSAVFITLFVVWGFITPGHLDKIANQALNFTIENFGWFYMIVTTVFVVFALFLAFGPFGRLRLGKDHERPEYSFYTWVGMLFSAGIGVGFVFWGVAEPVLYFVDTPEGIAPGTIEAAETGLRYAVFHWALHPWAIFSIVAIALGYVQYRKDEPGLISSAFRPLIGQRAEGSLGNTIDIMAVIATCTGVATTFGLSALQISGGLSYISDIPNQAGTQLTIIAIVTVLFLISAATGLDKGIRYLSVINLSLAGLLLVLMIIVGPTLFIFENMTTTLGGYIANVIPMSLTLTPYTDSPWLGTFTIFYWAWHISWAPFVGTFIARISRGRTIREFITGVLLVPSVLAIIWFTAFGGSGLNLEIFEGIAIADIVTENEELALFATLAEYPLAMLTSIVAIIVILIFFVTSADSATFVLGTLTSKGSLNPTLPIKMVWGFLIAAIASVLLLSGGLEGLQTASIIAALPFAFIMLAMVVSIIKMLNQDLKLTKRRSKAKERAQMKEELTDEIQEELTDQIQEELTDQIQEELSDQFQEEIGGQIKEEQRERLKEELSEQIKEELLEEIKEDDEWIIHKKDQDDQGRETKHHSYNKDQ